MLLIFLRSFLKNSFAYLLHKIEEVYLIYFWFNKPLYTNIQSLLFVQVPKALPKVGQVDLPQIMRVFTQVYLFSLTNYNYD